MITPVVTPPAAAGVVVGGGSAMPATPVAGAAAVPAVPVRASAAPSAPTAWSRLELGFGFGLGLGLGSGSGSESGVGLGLGLANPNPNPDQHQPLCPRRRLVEPAGWRADGGGGRWQEGCLLGGVATTRGAARLLGAPLRKVDRPAEEEVGRGAAAAARIGDANAALLGALRRRRVGGGRRLANPNS